ncbi:hypothetical protein D3C85_1360430 [compost metagenome]
MISASASMHSSLTSSRCDMSRTFAGSAAWSSRSATRWWALISSIWSSARLADTRARSSWRSKACCQSPIALWSRQVGA